VDSIRATRNPDSHRKSGALAPAGPPISPNSILLHPPLFSESANSYQNLLIRVSCRRGTIEPVSRWIELPAVPRAHVAPGFTVFENPPDRVRTSCRLCGLRHRLPSAGFASYGNGSECKFPLFVNSSPPFIARTACFSELLKTTLNGWFRSSEALGLCLSTDSPFGEPTARKVVGVVGATGRAMQGCMIVPLYLPLGMKGLRRWLLRARVSGEQRFGAANTRGL